MSKALSMSNGSAVISRLVAPNGRDVCFSIEAITPEIAAEYLKLNVMNRRVRVANVEKFAADMEAGEWEINHQGVAFYSDGTLADGQHRLLAIVASGVSVDMVVSRGWPVKSGGTIDIGGVRKTADLTMRDDEALTDTECQTAKALIEYRSPSGKSRFTHRQMIEVARRHLVAIRFAAHGLSSKKQVGANAVVRSVVARAYYTESSEALARFMEVLGSGFSTDAAETAAIALRNWIVATPAATGARGARYELALKTHSAISAFVRGDERRFVRAAGKLIYLLPEESEARDARREREKK